MTNSDWVDTHKHMGDNCRINNVILEWAELATSRQNIVCFTSLLRCMTLLWETSSLIVLAFTKHTHTHVAKTSSLAHAHTHTHKTQVLLNNGVSGWYEK